MALHQLKSHEQGILAFFGMIILIMSIMGLMLSGDSGYWTAIKLHSWIL